MWAIRILSGPQAGQIYNLKLGRNTIGRSVDSDIKITTQGISKHHCEVHVGKDKIVLTDLQSSNGTYLNGVKIQNGIIHIGEKFSIHDVVADLIPAPEMRRPQTPTYRGNTAVQPRIPQQVPSGVSQSYPMTQSQGDVIAGPWGAQNPQMQSQPWAQGAGPNSSPQASLQAQNFFKTISESLSAYMEKVVLPGVYRLAQVFDFKWVLGGFVAVYILSVTILSIIPTTQLAKSSIMLESQRRAQSLARNLAMANRKALVENNLSSLSTYSAEVEDGVKSVFLMQDSDGMILAPATKAGRISDLSFTSQVRKERRPLISNIDGSTIGASFPIDAYDAEAGEMKIKAHAVIIYDVSSVSFDESKTISLFMQTLMLASLFGALLFYFLFKLIEFPLQSLNRQLDVALREKTSDLEMTFQFPVLRDLTSTMNSILTRQFTSSEGGSSQGFMSQENKHLQTENLVRMLGAPAVVLDSQSAVISVNLKFEQLCRVEASLLKMQGLQSIPDGALQQNISALVLKSQGQPEQLHTDQLEFSGHQCSIQCQAFTTSGIVDYYLVTILAIEEGGS